MIRQSFRTRIGLLSTSLSGLVLVAFGVACWGLIYRANLTWIDRELQGRGERELARRHPPEHWAVVGTAFRRAVDSDGQTRLSLVLLVKDRANRVLFQSPEWPPAIGADAFPPPHEGGEFLPPEQQPERPPPPPPDGRPPRKDRVLPDGAMPPPPGVGNRRPPPPFPPPGRPPLPGDFARPPGFGPPPPDAPGFEAGQPPPPPRLRRPQFATRLVAGRRWRLGIMENEELKLILGADLDAVTAGMRRVGNAFLLVLPAALLLIAAGSWWLAQRALRPVLDLTRTVERVTAKGLDQRVAGQDADAEFRQLIAMFNQMMDRLERSFQQATRFSADAAHELKTPLTILQGRLEQALQRAPAGSDEQRTYGALAEEVQRLKVLVQRLLLLARADSGQLVLHLEAIDLTGIVEELGADVAVLAPHLKVEKEIAPQAMVLADAALLTQLLRNLTDNAVKYNVAKGQVRFHLRTDAGQARFTLANTGQTIPPEARERIFDRFYRGNAAHSRETDGVGLGLSLAREIARAHHGDLVLDPTEPGLISFTLTLPGAAKHS